MKSSDPYFSSLNSLGTANYSEFYTSLNQKLKFDENLPLLSIVALHESLHHLQLVSTLDGISWFLHNVNWTDALLKEISNHKGEIQIPIKEHKGFDSAKIEYVKCIADEHLFMKGNPTFFEKDIPLPRISIGPMKNVPFNNVYLYEGFARINEKIYIEKYDPKFVENDNSGVINLIYDWPFIIEESIGSLNLLTLLASIDLALMRPIFSWGDFGIEQALPVYRFKKILDGLLLGEINSIDELSQIEEYQNNICDLYNWKKPIFFLNEYTPFFNDYAQSWAIDYSLLNGEDLKEFSQHTLSEYRMEMILKAIQIRQNYDSDEKYKFIMPGNYEIDNLIDFFPYHIRHREGQFVTISEISSFSVGRHEYHSGKVKLCKQLMENNHIDCMYFRLSKQEEKCPFDSTCYGRFPRIDRKIPKCPLSLFFEEKLNHSLLEVTND